MEVETITEEASPSLVCDKRDEVDVLDLLIHVARRTRLIVWATLCAALAALILSLLLPNRYTATAKILPPQQNQSLAASLMGQLGSLGPLAAMAQGGVGIKNPSDTYVGMLKSRTVEDALVHRFDLMKIYRDSRMSDARADLEKASEITVGKEGFISISVEDRDSKRSAAMANAYVSELQKLTQNVAVTEAGQRRLFFEQQVKQASDSLAAAEQALKEMQMKTGIIQIDAQTKAIIESVARIKGQIAGKEVQLQAMHAFATEQNPDVLLTGQELAGLRVQLAKLERQQNTGGGDVQIPTGQVPEAGLEYVRRLRDVKYNESMLEFLAKQHELAKLDEARQGALIQVVDPAVEPDKKSWPKRTLMIAIAASLGFLGSILFIILSKLIEGIRTVPNREKRLEILRSILRFS